MNETSPQKQKEKRENFNAGKQNEKVKKKLKYFSQKKTEKYMHLTFKKYMKFNRNK